jgi:hypothetical protein
MLGFLFQWPTLLTLAMFPVLVWMYMRLARREEHEALAAFGDAYARYAAWVPGFVPRLGRAPVPPQTGASRSPVAFPDPGRETRQQLARGEQPPHEEH